MEMAAEGSGPLACGGTRQPSAKMDFVPDLLNSRKRLVVWAEAFHSCSSFAWVPQAKAECLRGAQCQGDMQREERIVGQRTAGSGPGAWGDVGLQSRAGWADLGLVVTCMPSPCCGAAAGLPQPSSHCTSTRSASTKAASD